MTLAAPDWRRSLGARLALAYAGVFLLSAAVLFALAYVLLAGSLRDRDRALVAGEVGEFAAELGGGGVEALRAEVAQASAEPGSPSYAVRLVDASGRPSLTAPEAVWEGYAAAPLAALAPGAWATLDGEGGALDLDVTAARLPDGGTLYVGAPASRDAVLDHFRELVALILLPVLALGVGGGLVFARRALAPLRDLAETVDRVATTGRLGERVPQRGTGDELDALAGLVNGMLARVEALVAGMRGTLDDAAHDLRTPLTRLRAGAERALLGAPDGHADALSDAVENTDSVLAVLDAVMDVAEADAGTLPLHLAPTDLAALVAQVADLYDLVAEEKGTALAVEPTPPVVVSADGTRVRQAVANLVDNALKYTPPGGHVWVSVGREGGDAVVVVRDDGPGVAPGDRPRIWDRLYRADKSRSERGLGLGLSVVRAVAEAHGGTATVEDAPGGGSRFALRLPSDRAPGDRAPGAGPAADLSPV